MMKNGGRNYLRELVGRPFNDGANIIGNYNNQARLSLVFPNRNTNLVPYDEMLF